MSAPDLKTLNAAIDVAHAKMAVVCNTHGYADENYAMIAEEAGVVLSDDVQQSIQEYHAALHAMYTARFGPTGVLGPKT